MSVNQIIQMMTTSVVAAKKSKFQQKLEQEFQKQKRGYNPPDDMDNYLIQQYRKTNRKRIFWYEFKSTATYVIPGFTCYFLALFWLFKIPENVEDNFVLALMYLFLSSIFGTLTYKIAVKSAKRK